MPEQSARLGIPLPLGNENVSRQAIREMLQAVDDHAETIPGAQAKADAAEAAAKSHADGAAGTVDNALAAHKADNVQHISYATASGTNTYTASITNIASLAEGLSVKIKFTNANTGASTLNINSLGAKSLIKGNGGALSSGSIKAGQIVHLVYTGSNFQLLGEGGEYGTAGAGQVLSGYTIGTENGLESGTMPNNGNQSTTMTITGSGKPSSSIPAGYITGGSITAQLSSSLASIILSGNTIGGVAGTYVAPTSPTLSGDAVASNVLSGKTFYNTNASNKLTGTMASNGSQTATLQITGSTKPTKTVPAGYTTGGTITAELASNLASKILSGNTIGGVAGTAIDGSGMKKYASGSKTTETLGSYNYLKVSGLAFRPSFVLVKVDDYAYLLGMSSYTVYFGNYSTAYSNSGVSTGYEVASDGFSIITRTSSYSNVSCSWQAWS